VLGQCGQKTGPQQRRLAYARLAGKSHDPISLLAHQAVEGSDLVRAAEKQGSTVFVVRNETPEGTGSRNAADRHGGQNSRTTGGGKRKLRGAARAAGARRRRPKERLPLLIQFFDSPTVDDPGRRLRRACASGPQVHQYISVRRCARRSRGVGRVGCPSQVGPPCPQPGLSPDARRWI
jgi:hypothetical protein